MPPGRFGVQLWGPLPIPKVIEQVRLAEELGYDSAWLIDSQLIAPELYVKLTACALNTRRITLGAGVTNTVTRYPTVTASALAALADLAPGRIAAALSVGGSSVKSVGLPTAKLADLRRDYELVARLLQGERFPHNGREMKLVWADPAATQRVPLSLQAHGPRGQRRAGEMGVTAGFSSELHQLDDCIGNIMEGRAAAAGIRRASRSAGRFPLPWPTSGTPSRSTA